MVSEIFTNYIHIHPHPNILTRLKTSEKFGLLFHLKTATRSQQPHNWGRRGRKRASCVQLTNLLQKDNNLACVIHQSGNQFWPFLLSLETDGGQKVSLSVGHYCSNKQPEEQPISKQCKYFVASTVPAAKQNVLNAYFRHSFAKIFFD